MTLLSWDRGSYASPGAQVPSREFAILWLGRRETHVWTRGLMLDYFLVDEVVGMPLQSRCSHSIRPSCCNALPVKRVGWVELCLLKSTHMVVKHAAMLLNI